MDNKEVKKSDTLDEKINRYYKEKYSCYEKNLNKLIEQINRDFLLKEKTLSEAMIDVEEDKNQFLKDLK